MMRGPLVAAALVMALGQPALACTYPRIVPNLPTGLSEEEAVEFLAAYDQAVEAHRPYAEAARVYDHQEQMWREAESVVLVRVIAFNRRDLQLTAHEWRKRLAADPTVLGATLEPVRWLKGEGQSTSFRVGVRGGGDCSVPAAWQYDSAKVGDVFVAYFKAGPLSNDTVLDGLAPKSVVEPNVRGLLALQQ